jgi:phosphoribosylaminoimidazole-succinocarboxamide synthase
MSAAVERTDLPGLPPPRRGKVRDVYDLGELVLFVACDRISAYDHVLSPAVPGKGKILHQLSCWWFERIADLVPNHLVATRVDDMPAEIQRHRSVLEGRTALVRKAEVIPFECVARGYLAGSGWKEYQASGTVCGESVPEGLRRAERLPRPIFTPATKAETGHDENVSFEVMSRSLGNELATTMRDITLGVYRRAHEIAAAAGLLLADTKFEIGWIDGRLHLVDEVLTPDSSRFWDAASWEPGREPVSFDKQPVRDWLDASGWDHVSTPPTLPASVVDATLERYREAFRRITGAEVEL